MILAVKDKLVSETLQKKEEISKQKVTYAKADEDSNYSWVIPAVGIGIAAAAVGYYVYQRNNKD